MTDYGAWHNKDRFFVTARQRDDVNTVVGKIIRIHPPIIPASEPIPPRLSFCTWTGLLQSSLRRFNGR